MLRLPDVLRVLMENFWGWKRRTARLVRPLAERVGAGRLVAPEEVFDAFERLYREIEEVRDILLDETRTSARLVVNPARVVLEESRRSFAYLCLFGVAIDAVLINRVLPEQAGRGYFARWAERERAELAEIESSFPVPQLRAALRSRELDGLESLRALGRELYAERDPAEIFVQRRPIRLDKQGGKTRLSIDLPTARPDELEVASLGNELLVSVRDCQRRIALPASLAGLELASAQLTSGVLEITFESLDVA
jgi:arsenite-transporting ATPase